MIEITYNEQENGEKALFHVKATQMSNIQFLCGCAHIIAGILSAVNENHPDFMPDSAEFVHRQGMEIYKEQLTQEAKKKTAENGNNIKLEDLIPESLKKDIIDKIFRGGV